MARKERLDKLAKRYMTNSNHKRAEFYRITESTGLGEYVLIEDGKVVKYETEQINYLSDKVDVTKKDSIKKSQNDMELRGVIYVQGSPVEFYGSEKGWQKLQEYEHGIQSVENRG